MSSNRARQQHPSSSPSSSSSPPLYYSMLSFAYIGPLGLLYSWTARLWLKLTAAAGGSRNAIERPLPPPPPPAAAAAAAIASASASKNQNEQEEPRRRRRTVAIVTGSNTGIGYETARHLAAHYGCTVILACRSRDKAAQAAAAINATIIDGGGEGRGGQAVVAPLPLDLASLDSVRAFARHVRQHYSSGIDVLVNNAGRNTNGEPLDYCSHHGGKRQQQKPKHQSLDLLFQSNFLGHFLLTAELMPLLLLASSSGSGSGAPPARVVNVSSVMHHFADMGDVTSVGAWKDTALAADAATNKNSTYARSKLAAVLLTGELNRRYNGNRSESKRKEGNTIQSVAVNPGAVNSDIWRDYPRLLDPVHRLLYLTNEQGCRTSVAACVLEDIPDNTLFPYLQPYWQLFDSSSNISSPLFPALELVGPYQGYRWTAPRVPAGDEGRAAAQALWRASNELTGAQWPE